MQLLSSDHPEKGSKCFSKRIDNYYMKGDVLKKSILERGIVLIQGFVLMAISYIPCLCSISYSTLFFWHQHAESRTQQVQDSCLSRFLLHWIQHLEWSPTDLWHSSTLSSLKPNWKLYSFYSTSAPTNINTRFSLQFYLYMYKWFEFVTFKTFFFI